MPLQIRFQSYCKNDHENYSSVFNVNFEQTFVDWDLSKHWTWLNFKF